MNLLISPVFACLASTAATHGNAEESTETNIYSRPSTGLDNDDSIETDFAIWNDLLDTLQVPMQNDNAHSSAHDSECMCITELNLPQNGVTCTGTLICKAVQPHNHLWVFQSNTSHPQGRKSSTSQRQLLKPRSSAPSTTLFHQPALVRPPTTLLLVSENPCRCFETTREAADK